MGGTSYSSQAYQNLRSSYAGKSMNQVFTNTGKQMSQDMNPKGVAFRESRDSDAHPNSLPIIVALDVTGSMGRIPENLIKNKLGALMETLINHGVKDASICFVAIGDHYTDDYPLQIGQFESGTIELDKWLTSINIEQGGGGQMMESYQLAWLFAARHTSTDSFEKRGIKGFVFTIGDEFVHHTTEEVFLKDYMGYNEASNLRTEDLLQEAQKSYHVFHIHCNDGSYQKRVSDEWKELMKENVLILDDSNVIAETIATTVAVINGADMKDVVSSFDSATASKVKNALAVLPKTAITEQRKGAIQL